MIQRRKFSAEYKCEAVAMLGAPGVHYQTRAEARADIFDYTERWLNPRQRRRLDLQQQGERLLT